MVLTLNKSTAYNKDQIEKFIKREQNKYYKNPSTYSPFYLRVVKFNPNTTLGKSPELGAWFQCKKDRCSSSQSIKGKGGIWRKFSEKSTGALINHSRSCRGHDYNGSQRVFSLKDGNINYEASPKAQQALIIIELITVNGMPFNSTSWVPLKTIFQKAYGFPPPSPSSVSRLLGKVFMISEKYILEELKEVNKFVHISIDTWTSRNACSFMGVIVSYYHNKSSFHLLFRPSCSSRREQLNVRS